MQLIWTEEHDSLSSARKRENQLKRWSHKKKAAKQSTHFRRHLITPLVGRSKEKGSCGFSALSSQPPALILGPLDVVYAIRLLFAMHEQSPEQALFERDFDLYLIFRPKVSKSNAFSECVERQEK